VGECLLELFLAVIVYKYIIINYQGQHKKKICFSLQKQKLLMKIDLNL